SRSVESSLALLQTRKPASLVSLCDGVLTVLGGWLVGIAAVGSVASGASLVGSIIACVLVDTDKLALFSLVTG
ncbi:MAG: hypothetical protein KAT29_10890, partial [Anaerolineales bacterium]|nr:hypothetical protein [Anaerolineales bacterium]